MSKSKRTRSSAQAQRAAAPRRPELAPDWVIAALAALGLLITGYLSLVALSDSGAAFCTAGSGCDIVQQSRWSTLFGIPIAIWGFGLYLLLGLSALLRTRAVKRWRRIWSLSLIGVAISLYLGVVAWVMLDAVCIWCMASLLLITAIFVLASVRRPDTAPGMPLGRWLLSNSIVLVALLGFVGLAQSGVLEPPEDARIKALAEHLDARGVKFYGAYWCPNCQEQKDLFGRSADRLPYVECSPNGRTGAVAFECVSAGVAGFPTWIIRGRPYVEVLQPEELARRSGFDWAGFTPEP